MNHDNIIICQKPLSLSTKRDVKVNIHINFNKHNGIMYLFIMQIYLSFKFYKPENEIETEHTSPGSEVFFEART
jgi:hypothetical protein